MATSPPSSKIPRKLKPADAVLLSTMDSSVRSDTLHASSVPSGAMARNFYLTQVDLKDFPPPLISHSEFVPPALVEHLMRRKKNSALGVKYIQRDSRAGKLDEITNMEGALHTFVTPVISRIEMVGDYLYRGSHQVSRFEDVVDSESGEKVTLSRSVVMSASVHLDFENKAVMLEVCKLGSSEFIGSDFNKIGWNIPSSEEKQKIGVREAYDDNLRRHMVFHLTRQGSLPAKKDVEDVLSLYQAITLLELLISDDHRTIVDDVVGKYLKLLNREVVSLELLLNASIHQLINEISALEALCPQGYVYTYDPASIFALETGPALLNRLMLAALRYLSDRNALVNLRVFAFNDYADPKILSLVSQSLKNQTKVQVTTKAKLFKKSDNKYDCGGYEEGKGAMLVVHNNSDGFGQNIETEGQYGSLDGAIGVNSSAAASLERTREDLVDFMF